ncbi:hypothetical protein [Streptomyces sp. G-G2]|uniref:hypothetical protein n=1 Tax=Streptomyces sp. G-G2 TaxID=3046201 RepID=UPI0024BA18E8|nr:hypothetical protein [Streptomyces sp. G-G2]MDJ0379340.1 hypothetical protein [Streptomyces sp. G-G2]
MNRLKDVKASHPTLTQEELDQECQAAVDRAEGIWKRICGDASWDGEDERNRHLADHLHEARQEAISDRAVGYGRTVDGVRIMAWPSEQGMTVGDIPTPSGLVTS